MCAQIWSAGIELKALAWSCRAESWWWGHRGKMQKMGFCCQSLENPLLMEWEKAERDSESDGRGGRDITLMSAGEWLQRQCVVFVCVWVNVGSCESKMGWNKWSRAKRLPTKHHYKQLQKYYAFGVTIRVEEGGISHKRHTAAYTCTRTWSCSVVSTLDINSICLL